MLAGVDNGEEISLSKLFEAVGAREVNTITDADLRRIEHDACPDCGSCAGMYTANSMNCLSEAIGIALPGNGTVPTVMAERGRLSKRSGMQIMDLVRQNITARKILTPAAFQNALACDMALGCSTNSVLHLLAIAHEAGVPLSLEDIAKVSARTPNLCHLAPAGPAHIQDLNAAGGIPAVMAELARGGFIDTSVMTATGKPLGETISAAKNRNPAIIRPNERPYSATGGVAVLWGNIAADGCVVKRSAVADEMLVHRGPARVFDSEEEAITAIYAKQIVAGDVVVIRYEGPKGGPGMREMLNPTSALAGMGLDRTVALITDGRFQRSEPRGVHRSCVAGEAAAGGAVGLPREGDMICIDIPNARIDALVCEEEFAARRATQVMPDPASTSGWLARYARGVSSANTSAVMK